MTAFNPTEIVYGAFTGTLIGMLLCLTMLATMGAAWIAAITLGWLLRKAWPLIVMLLAVPIAAVLTPVAVLARWVRPAR